MLTSKQRAKLRSLANGIDTILYVGKDQIGENLIQQARDALKARELIKGKVLENSWITPAEAGSQIAESTDSELVATIGSKFILYKRNPENARIVF